MLLKSPYETLPLKSLVAGYSKLGIPQQRSSPSQSTVVMLPVNWNTMRIPEDSKVYRLSPPELLDLTALGII